MKKQNITAHRRVRLAVAAEIAGVHRLTLRRWGAEGRIQLYRVGPRLIMVDLDELDALLRPIGGAA